MLKFLRPIVTVVFTSMESRLQVNRGVIRTVADARRRQRSSLALEYWGWKKFFNILRLEIGLRLGSQKIGGTPFEWEIDTTNICQLRCPLCHTGLGNIHRDKGVMHFDLYKRTIDQIKDYAVWLTLYSWGEPFLNPRIAEFIQYAHQRNIATIASTNLNRPLTPEMADSVIRAGLDVMIISLDGTTQEVYQQYRIGGQLDRVMNNARLLVERKRVLNSATPYLEWQFIVMKQNEHQVDDARVLAEQLGVDSIVFKKVDFPLGESRPELASKWLPESEHFRRANPFDRPFRETGERCWRLWRTTVVNWDGGVSPCCYLTDESDDFGDLNTRSVQEIKNNEKYQTARGLFRKDFTPETYTGCQTCPVYTETAYSVRRGEIDVPVPAALPDNNLSASSSSASE